MLNELFIDGLVYSKYVDKYVTFYNWPHFCDLCNWWLWKVFLWYQEWKVCHLHHKMFNIKCTYSLCYIVSAMSYEDVLLLFKCQVVSYFVNLMLHRLHLKAKQTSSFWDFTKSDGSISTLDWDSLSMLFSVSISMSSFSFSMVTSSALTTSTFSSLNVSWLKFEDLSYFNSLS